MSQRTTRFGVALILALAMILGACGPAVTPTPAQPTTAVQLQPTAPQPTAVPTEAPFVLTMWWWGEQGLGQEEWVNDTIARYEKLHPNITVDVVFQGLDEVLTNFAAAGEANQGPDIATLWYGMYMYDALWANQLAPIDAYVSKDEMSHWSGMALNYFDGKMWAGNIYNQSNSMSYNKKLFAQAGLDPERPPLTWDEFMADCAALKKAGITCVGIGTKDGWVQGPFTNLFMSQTTSVKDVTAAVIGDRSWTEKPFADFWYRVAELRDKGYVNEDATSLDYFTGQSLLEAGKAAFTFHASDASAAMILRAGDDVIGSMAAPSVTGQPLGWLPGISYAFFITTWSPQKAAAADFITFFHTPDVLNSAYAQMKGVVLPADDRFDSSVVEIPGIRNIVALQQEGFRINELHLDAILPWAIMGDGMMPAFQLMFSENMSPEEAAAMTEEAIKNWRAQNPEVLGKYEQFAAGQ